YQRRSVPEYCRASDEVELISQSRKSDETSLPDLACYNRGQLRVHHQRRVFLLLWWPQLPLVLNTNRYRQERDSVCSQFEWRTESPLCVRRGSAWAIRLSFQRR